MDVIVTDRLVLRPYTADDIDACYEISRNPNVGPRAGWTPHQSKEETMMIIASFIKSDEVWAVTRKSDGVLMGSVGLHQNMMRKKLHNYAVRELGYVLGQQFWGNGYMTEAAGAALQYGFEVLKLDMMCIGHFDFNERSKRVIQKLGFIEEAHLRNVYEYEGKLVGEYIYNMTREEYEQRQRMLKANNGK